MRILFVCTSNKSRSRALEYHFREKYPQHEYLSAGINNYLTGINRTRTISQEDVNWADYIVCADRVHYEYIFKNFIHEFGKPYIILNAGHYDKNNMSEYVGIAEVKIKTHLNFDTCKNAPESIWLQIGEEAGENVDFQDLDDEEAVTWSIAKVYDNDIKYSLDVRNKR